MSQTGRVCSSGGCRDWLRVDPFGWPCGSSGCCKLIATELCVHAGLSIQSGSFLLHLGTIHAKQCPIHGKHTVE